jgi:hypothetical protein
MRILRTLNQLAHKILITEAAANPMLRTLTVALATLSAPRDQDPCTVVVVVIQKTTEATIISAVAEMTIITVNPHPISTATTEILQAEITADGKIIKTTAEAPHPAMKTTTETTIKVVTLLVLAMAIVMATDHSIKRDAVGSKIIAEATSTIANLTHPVTEEVVGIIITRQAAVVITTRRPQAIRETIEGVDMTVEIIAPEITTLLVTITTTSEETMTIIDKEEVTREVGASLQVASPGAGTEEVSAVASEEVPTVEVSVVAVAASEAVTATIATMMFLKSQTTTRTR